MLAILILIGILGILSMFLYKPKYKSTPAPYQKEKTEQDAAFNKGKANENFEKTDQEFSQAVWKYIQDYPWILDLPIETKEYRVIYDLQKENFRIRLKISRNSPQDIIDNLTNKALEKIKEIYDKEPIPYYVVFID